MNEEAVREHTPGVEEERARRILADLIPPDKQQAALDRSWLLIPDPATGAVTYAVPTEQGLVTLTLHSPENFVTAFLAESEEAHRKLVTNAKTGEPVVGTALGHNLKPAIEALAHNIFGFFIRVVGEKVSEMLEESSDEAMTLAMIHADAYFTRELRDSLEGEFSPSASALVKIDSAVSDSAKRRRERMRERLSRLPPDDEVVARAVAMLKKSGECFTLATLAMRLNDRFGYELTDDALRKRFERAGLRWREVKTGQK